MTYTPDKPRTSESSEQLRARIPGWGVDLDPADRPSYPAERFDPELTDVHEPPVQQQEKWPRERSIEHERLTPVFGTSTPPRGLSGAIRKYSYARYSEARTAHWLLLITADRVDTVESVLRSFVTLRPDNPVTQTGLLSEFRNHPVASRKGTGRADLTHQWIDPIIVLGPWVVAGRATYKLLRRARRR